MPEKYITLNGKREQVGIMRITGCRPARTAEVVVYSTREQLTVPLHSIEYVFPKPYSISHSINA